MSVETARSPTDDDSTPRGRSCKGAQAGVVERRGFLRDSNPRPMHYETISDHVAWCCVVPCSGVFPVQSTFGRLTGTTPCCTVQRRLSTGCPPEVDPSPHARPSARQTPTPPGLSEIACPTPTNAASANSHRQGARPAIWTVWDQAEGEVASAWVALERSGRLVSEAGSWGTKQNQHVVLRNARLSAGGGTRPWLGMPLSRSSPTHWVRSEASGWRRPGRAGGRHSRRTGCPSPRTARRTRGGGTHSGRCCAAGPGWVTTC